MSEYMVLQSLLTGKYISFVCILYSWLIQLYFRQIILEHRVAPV